MEIPHVVLGVPNKGFVTTELLTFAPEIMAKKTAKISIFAPDSTPHDSTRNLIVKSFLAASQATHLLFVDSDVVITGDTLKTLLSHDKDIVGANVKMYLRAQNNYCIAAGFRDKIGDFYSHEGLDEKCKTSEAPFEVDMVGFGCVLIKRGVLEKIPKPCFKFCYDNDGVIKKGEDVYFCELAKESGYSIYLDHKTECVHRKTVDLK